MKIKIPYLIKGVHIPAGNSGGQAPEPAHGAWYKKFHLSSDGSAIRRFKKFKKTVEAESIGDIWKNSVIELYKLTERGEKILIPIPA